MSEAILAFQAQLSGVMETVFKAAMYEIVRLVEDSFLEEVSRSREQVETLKKRLQWSESKREASGRARCAECGRAGAEADVGQTEDRSPGPAHGVTENRGLKQEGAQEIKWAGCPREDVEPLRKVLNQEAVLSTDKLSEEITSYPNLQQAVHVEGDKLKKEGFQLAAGSPRGPERWPVSLEAEEGNPARLHGDFGERQAQCSAEDWAPSSGPASQQPLKVHLPYGANFDTEAICGLEDALRTEAKAPCFAPVFDVRELGSQALQDAFGAPARMQTELEGVRVDERAPVLPGPLRSRRAACSNQQGAPSLSPHGDVDVGELSYLLINEDGYLQDAGDGFWGQGQLGPVDGGERSQKKLHDQDPMAVDRSGELNSERLHAAPTGVRERPRSCAQCRVSFPDSASLKAHMSTHKASTAYTCTQCGKSFTQACNLKVHQRIHSRDGLHLCSHCGKGFVAFSDLKKHKCSHAGDKPYCCMLCGNKFSRLWNLKLHRRIHTQEKPHRCTQCEKSFTRADILKVHQRTHTGERPYCCTLCGLSFKRLDHLKSHQRKHKPQQT